MNTNNLTHIINQKDYVQIDFSYKRGCEDLHLIDNMELVSQELRSEARLVLESEINAKLDKVYLNPWCYCWILVYMILFVVGGVGSVWFFPYNFILTGLGFVAVGIFVYLTCSKVCYHEKFFKHASEAMDLRTGGKVVLDPVMET